MLPKPMFSISHIKQPSTRKIIDGKETFTELKFRPYLVREEKILLTAKESGEIKDIFQAVKQVVQACSEEPNFDADKIPTFDLEYFFLQLRAISVSDIENIMITENDGSEWPGKLNFKKIEVLFPDDMVSPIIYINPTTSLVMKYPSAEVYNESNSELFKKLKDKNIYDLVLACIDNVYQGDILIKLTPDEMREFLDGLGIPIYKKMKEFLMSMPRLEHRLIYRKNEIGEERFIQFSSLLDFFPFL